MGGYRAVSFNHLVKAQVKTLKSLCDEAESATSNMRAAINSLETEENADEFCESGVQYALDLQTAAISMVERLGIIDGAFSAKIALSEPKE